MWPVWRPALSLALLALFAPWRAAPVEPNLQLIGAPQAWARGVTGQGVTVALLDTGVDLSQPELAARWRGGANSWFDPYQQHPDQPIDLNGHGTQMLGIILGGDDGGAQHGVAPDARWIAARVFDDRGHTTRAALHAALRWVLDPDGNPATPDAPQVVNNSWSSATALCDAEFEPDLRALRAAGILPVFAAGAGAPASPATLPEALAVGALLDARTLTNDSPRGPAPCAAGRRLFPDLVAPGDDILTTDRSGLFTRQHGTSVAAAHVSGALALLLSARPGLSADQQAAWLQSGAVDLGDPGPDNDYGAGRLDIGASVDQVLGPSWLIPAFWAFGLGASLALLGLGLRWRHQRRQRRASPVDGFDFSDRRL